MSHNVGCIPYTLISTRILLVINMESIANPMHVYVLSHIHACTCDKTMDVTKMTCRNSSERPHSSLRIRHNRDVAMWRLTSKVADRDVSQDAAMSTTTAHHCVREAKKESKIPGAFFGMAYLISRICACLCYPVWVMVYISLSIDKKSRTARSVRSTCEK